MISCPPSSKTINLLGTRYNAALNTDTELMLCTPGCCSWDPFLTHVFNFPVILFLLNREQTAGPSCSDGDAGDLLHQCVWQYMEDPFLLIPFSPGAASKPSALPFPGVQASSTGAGSLTTRETNQHGGNMQLPFQRGSHLLLHLL